MQTKINIGCGYDKRADYLNIDSDPACEPDVLIHNNDLSGLPQSHFEEALALDVLEHIPRIHTVGALFDWGLLLRPGGRLFVETSYLYGIIDIMRRADDFETVHNWKRCLFGNQVHPGDYHFNGFTPKTLATYLKAAGFTPDPLQVREDWLVYGWATKTEDWSELLAIGPSDEFIEKAFRSLLGRNPEPIHFERLGSRPNSAERLAAIRSIATSEERLYRIGSDIVAH